jgi:hypothetical protein
LCVACEDPAASASASAWSGSTSLPASRTKVTDSDAGAGHCAMLFGSPCGKIPTRSPPAPTLVTYS